MTTQAWHLILDGTNPAAYNMAVDEALLQEATSVWTALTYLRFFQWARPTLSLGFSQKSARVVDFAFCRERGIELVRRITGGKAVLHHHELTYSIVSNDARFFPLDDIGETYRRIALALVLGFRHLGIETSLAGEVNSRGQMPRSPATSACFALSNHHEILCSGRKLVGSAQRRTKTAFLQHGSILLDFDPDLLAGALGSPCSADLGAQVASLTACLGWRPEPDELSLHLQRGIREFFGVDLVRTSLDAKQRQVAQDLACTKYAQLDWSPLRHAKSEVQFSDSAETKAGLWTGRRSRSDSPKMA
jgi:lipoate-protein ligase A